MTSRATLAAVNVAIAKAGGVETLVRGREYFYFTGGTAGRWPATAVYVAQLGQLTVEQWVAEWKRLRGA